MKVGILGDIHGNYLALRAVLEAANEQGVERLLITGDLVGYYFWPAEVLDLLASWNIEVVRGNHEEMLAGARREPSLLEEVERRYGSGIRVALEVLSPAQLDWLENLPHPQEVRVGDYRILLGHGSPWGLSQYIYPDVVDSFADRLSATGYDLIVLGHTHYPMERQCGKVMVVNPGSVGQPRNRQPGAHWMVLDTEQRTISKYIEAYDIDWVVRQSHRRHPHFAYLVEVLSRA